MMMTRAMTLKDLNLDTSKYVIAHRNHYWYYCNITTNIEVYLVNIS